MKKIFSFFVAKGLYTTLTNRLLCKVAIFVLVALFALPVMAGTIDVLDNSWMVNHHFDWGGISYNSETKTITFDGEWKACGWDLESLNIPTSEWLSITVEFTSTAPKGVLKCEYTDGGTNEENFEGKTSQTLNFASEKTLKKIYLTLENSGSLTLTSAVVTFDEDTRCDYSQTIQCEIYQDQSGYADLFTSELKPSNTETWNASSDKIIKVGDSGKEIFFYVNLPINAVYTFSPYVFEVHDHVVYLNIYSQDGDKSGSVQYGGYTYTKKFEGQKVSTPANEYNWDTYGCYQTCVHELNAGTYILGLYGEEEARYDKIVISAKDDAFCGNAITMTKTEGGSADPTATVEEASVTAAMDGTTVTVTAAAASAGYNFSGWTALPEVDFDDSASPITTFVMPASAVTITANYEACTQHTVTLTAGANGSVDGGGDYCEGASVTVTATPKSGYRFVNWTNTSSEVVSTNAAYTFDLLADISLTANFEVDPCTNSKTIQCTSGYVPVTIYNNAAPYTEDKRPDCVVTTHDNASAYYYPLSIPTAISSFTLSIHIANSQNDFAWWYIYKKTANNSGDVEYDGAFYNKVGWQHMVASNSWNSEVFDDAITSFADGIEGVGSSIPAGDYLLALSAKNDARFYYFTLTTSENIFCPNTITMQKNGDDGAAAPTSSPASAAMAGTEVTITAGEASAGYYFSGWTVSPENAVTFDDSASPITTFVMPASNVTITANYGEVVSSEFTYTTSGSGSITCATTSGSSVVSGTPISMTAVPSTDYVFTGWTTTAGTFSDESELTTTFTMPSTAAEVTANFAQVDNKIITGNAVTTNHIAGDGTLEITSVPDFDAFNHNVLKFAYSNMDGKYRGFSISTDAGYSPSALVTGFGFYYKTEKSDDHVAFCFDPRKGQEQQIKWQLEATNNVWKYYYISTPHAINWNDNSGNDPLIIFMNGDDDDAGTHTTYKNGGAFYMSEIAATTITSKPEIANYHYTNNRGGEMQVNEYGTLCLPMAGTISGATLYSVAGKETGDISYLVLEDQGTNVEAGKPYITQSTATSYTVTMSGAHSAVQDGNGLKGTYELINLTPYDETHHNYFLYANAFKKAGTGVTVGAYRAYLNWDEVSAPAPAPSARRIRMVIEGQEVQTGIETVTAMPKTTKVLIDGQLFIIREGKRYTLTGARAQ